MKARCASAALTSARVRRRPRWKSPLEQRADRRPNLRPRGRSRAGDLEVSGARNDDEADTVTGARGGRLVGLHQWPRDKVLVLADNEHLRNAEGQQPDRRRVRIALRHRRWGTPEQARDDRVAAQRLVT